jgi:hypothetical protein
MTDERSALSMATLQSNNMNGNGMPTHNIDGNNDINDNDKKGSLSLSLSSPSSSSVGLISKGRGRGRPRKNTVTATQAKSSSTLASSPTSNEAAAIANDGKQDDKSEVSDVVLPSTPPKSIFRSNKSHSSFCLIHQLNG